MSELWQISFNNRIEYDKNGRVIKADLVKEVKNEEDTDGNHIQRW